MIRPIDASARPAPIMAAPNTTVRAMPTRSAIQPNAMAPAPEPSHASEFASAGIERALPRSAAIGLRATATISGAPYENVSMTSTTLAATHDAFVSMLSGVAVCACAASAAGIATGGPLAICCPP